MPEVVYVDPISYKDDASWSKAADLVLLDAVNVLRQKAGLTPYTEAQFRAAVKSKRRELTDT